MNSQTSSLEITDPMDWKDMKNILTCYVCLEIFKKPQVLPCNHIYCQTCIFGLPKHEIGGKEVLCCPQCDKIFGTGDYRCHTLIQEVLQLYDKKHPVNDKICMICKEGTVKWRCVDCSRKTCEKCQPSHNIEIPCGYSESAGALNVNDTNDTSYPLRHALLFCDKHGGLPLKYFCKPCNEFVCSECIPAHVQNERKEKIFDESSGVKPKVEIDTDYFLAQHDKKYEPPKSSDSSESDESVSADDVKDSAMVKIWDSRESSRTGFNKYTYDKVMMVTEDDSYMKERAKFLYQRKKGVEDLEKCKDISNFTVQEHCCENRLHEIGGNIRNFCEYVSCSKELSLAILILIICFVIIIVTFAPHF